MEYISSPSTDPRWNLALEQYVFDRLDRSRSYLLLWQNDNTIVIGKNQNAAAEINNAYVRQHNITVVRRLSGGGAVYHDLGNLNFTFIVDADQMEKINFRVFCQPIVETLASFGVEAALSGRNDITIGGRKFSGNAQYIRDHRVMHHGTLMFSSDISVVEKALRVDREKIISKGVASVSSRVTNLSEHLPPDVTLADFRRRLLEHISAREELHPYALKEQDRAEIGEIRRGRYDQWAWNYGCSPACTARHQKRVEGCGLIEVLISVRDGYIGELHFYGDFFGNGDSDELAERLLGCLFRRDAVQDCLKSCDLEYYIHNISAEQLAEVIVA